MIKDEKVCTDTRVWKLEYARGGAVGWGQRKQPSWQKLFYIRRYYVIPFHFLAKLLPYSFTAGEITLFLFYFRRNYFLFVLFQSRKLSFCFISGEISSVLFYFRQNYFQTTLVNSLVWTNPSMHMDKTTHELTDINKGT